MNDEQVLTLIREAILYADPSRQDAADKVAMDASLTDIGVESVMALEMAGYIEEKLNVEFPDSELGGIVNIAGFAKLVRRHARA